MRVWVLGALAALAAVSFAGPTGCVVIPIADILRHREGFAYVGAGGTERKISKDIAYVNSFNVGLFDRIELGYDNDFEGNTVFHGKVLAWEDEEKDAAVSFGWMNAEEDLEHAQPYLVVRKGFKNAPRIHVGAVRDDRWRMIYGLDYELNEDWVLAADYVSGPNSYTWLGATYAIASVPGLSLSATFGLPSVRDDGYQWAGYVNYGFRF